MFRTPSTGKLEDVDLFAGCSRSQLRRLGSLMTSVRVRPGTPLIREGGGGTEFLVITDGQARVTREVDDAPVTVADLGPGAFVGEMALLYGTPRSATVTSVSEVTLLVSSPTEFRELVRVAPAVARRIAEAAEHRAAVNQATGSIAA
ncbi:MAG TPA: cyclic nucleotide-binding domain-containing protein [Acidimicrobiales bacterium]|nr:cyclic nucleotide-binding domain-containing protein [Acidimicrobiales bacterium]